MAQLLVRNVPETVVEALKARAAEHGVSAEEEHRRILAEHLHPHEYDFKSHLSALSEVEDDVDGLIAATAIVHDLAIVTRNTNDFIRCGAKLINPWNDLCQ